MTISLMNNNNNNINNNNNLCNSISTKSYNYFSKIIVKTQQQ